MSNSQLPAHKTIINPKCWRCERILAAKITTPYSLRCSRCKATNAQQ